MTMAQLIGLFWLAMMEEGNDVCRGLERARTYLFGSSIAGAVEKMCCLRVLTSPDPQAAFCDALEESGLCLDSEIAAIRKAKEDGCIQLYFAQMTYGGTFAADCDCLAKRYGMFYKSLVQMLESKKGGDPRELAQAFHDAFEGTRQLRDIEAELDLVIEMSDFRQFMGRCAENSKYPLFTSLEVNMVRSKELFEDHQLVNRVKHLASMCSRPIVDK